MGDCNCACQDFNPRIHITESDFVSITDDGRLCDANGQLGPAEFEAVIRRQARATHRIGQRQEKFGT